MLDFGSPWWFHFNLINPLKAEFPSTIIFQSMGWLRLQHMGGHNSAHNRWAGETIELSLLSSSLCQEEKSVPDSPRQSSSWHNIWKWVIQRQLETTVRIAEKELHREKTPEICTEGPWVCCWTVSSKDIGWKSMGPGKECSKSTGLRVHRAGQLEPDHVE